jgi:hypothetical protein
MDKIHYVDFDGTLAFFDIWYGPDHLGAPIPTMVEKVKEWLSKGDRVVIYTSRLTPSEEFYTKDFDKVRRDIEEWCVKYIGVKLPITNIKSYATKYYDDRTRRIVRNTGLTVEEAIYRNIEIERANNSSKEEALNNIQNYIKILIEED